MMDQRPNETGRTDGGRDVLGRFTQGNRAAVGAGGNAGWLRRVREAFQDVVTPAEVAEVWRRILQQAKDGEPHAQALVVRYSGVPPRFEESKSDEAPALVLFGVDADAMREGRAPSLPAVAGELERALPRDALVEVAPASTGLATRSVATALDRGGVE